mgnify:CR=1 FL=1
MQKRKFILLLFISFSLLHKSVFAQAISTLLLPCEEAQPAGAKNAEILLKCAPMIDDAKKFLNWEVAKEFEKHLGPWQRMDVTSPQHTVHQMDRITENRIFNTSNANPDPGVYPCIGYDIPGLTTPSGPPKAKVRSGSFPPLGQETIETVMNQTYIDSTGMTGAACGNRTQITCTWNGSFSMWDLFWDLFSFWDSEDGWGLGPFNPAEWAEALQDQIEDILQIDVNKVAPFGDWEEAQFKGLKAFIREHHKNCMYGELDSKVLNLTSELCENIAEDIRGQNEDLDLIAQPLQQLLLEGQDGSTIDIEGTLLNEAFGKCLDESDIFSNENNRPAYQAVCHGALIRKSLWAGTMQLVKCEVMSRTRATTTRVITKHLTSQKIDAIGNRIKNEIMRKGRLKALGELILRSKSKLCQNFVSVAQSLYRTEINKLIKEMYEEIFKPTHCAI